VLEPVETNANGKYAAVTGGTAENELNGTIVNRQVPSAKVVIGIYNTVVI
jgi:ABC-type thiamine transport system substrate-binding protein